MSVPWPVEVGVAYVGSTDIERPRNRQECINATRSLLCEDGQRFVPPQEYVRVKLRVSPQAISLNFEGPHHGKSESWKMREVTLWSRAPSPNSHCFVFVTTNKIVGLGVGYVCHVCATNRRETSDRIVQYIGAAYTGSVTPSAMAREQSVASSSEYGSAETLERSRVNLLNSHHSLSSHGNDSSTGQSLQSASSVVAGVSLTLPRDSQHRRTRSDGGDALPDKLLEDAALLAGWAKRVHRMAQFAPNAPSIHTAAHTFRGRDMLNWLVEEGLCCNEPICRKILQQLLRTRLMLTVPDTSPPDAAEFELEGTYILAQDVPHTRPLRSESSPNQTTPPTPPATPSGTLSGRNTLNRQSIGQFADASENMQRLLQLVDLDANLEEVAELIDSSALGDEEKEALLYRSVKMGSYDIVKYLLCDVRVNVNMVHSSGETPLHRAAAVGNQRMAALLLEHGANLEAKTPNGVTPLLQCASRVKNLECLYLLLEYGARLGAIDNDGVCAKDLQRDLIEAQRLLCESCARGLEEGSSGTPALLTLSRMSRNEENMYTLMTSLKKPELIRACCALCVKEGEPAHSAMLSLLSNVFREGKQRQDAANHGLMDLLLQLLEVGDPSATAAKSLLVALLSDTQRNYASLLAKLDLAPLLRALGRVEHAEMAVALARIAHWATKYAAGARQLQNVTLVRCVAESLTRHRDNTHFLIECVPVVGNAAQLPSSHNVLEEGGALPLMRRLLSHPAKPVRQLAVRSIVYTGETDTGGVDLFEPSSKSWNGLSDEHNLLRTAPGKRSGELWSSLRGASLERLMLILTSPNNDNVICPVIFTMHRHYFSPIIIFRLLLHRFHSVEAHTWGEIPDVHISTCNLLKAWLVHAPEDFEDPQLQQALQEFLQHLRETGSGYAAIAMKLCEKSPPELPSVKTVSVREFQFAQHNQIYAELRNQILSGALSCPTDQAIELAALQVHIENLARKRLFFPEPMERSVMPPLKLKAVLPSSILKKCKDSKAIFTRIAGSYERMCAYSDRDAKHVYIRICTMRVVGCTYFKVKEFDNAKGRRVVRVLGVNEQTVSLFDKRRDLLWRHDLVSLRSFSVSVRDRNVPFWGGRSKSVHVMRMDFRGGEYFLQGDEDTLQTVTDCIKETIEAQRQRVLAAQQQQHRLPGAPPSPSAASLRSVGSPRRLPAPPPGAVRSGTNCGAAAASRDQPPMVPLSSRPLLRQEAWGDPAASSKRPAGNASPSSSSRSSASGAAAGIPAGGAAAPPPPSPTASALSSSSILEPWSEPSAPPSGAVVAAEDAPARSAVPGASAVPEAPSPVSTPPPAVRGLLASVRAVVRSSPRLRPRSRTEVAIRGGTRQRTISMNDDDFDLNLFEPNQGKLVPSSSTHSLQHLPTRERNGSDGSAASGSDATGAGTGAGGFRAVTGCRVRCRHGCGGAGTGAGDAAAASAGGGDGGGGDR
eukprot:m.224313 g.224313  ORF g.224313 m.224313 type:complete len:1448 (-) comp22336_c3_seq2:1549-5892(-)